MTSPPERTALYRYFDAADDLLYIGISKNPDARWAAHRYWGRRWPSLVASRRDEWFDSRPEAEDAEVAAIKAEKPRFNGAHNFVEVPIDTVDWPQGHGTQPDLATFLTSLVRGEIAAGRWEPEQRLPRLERLAGAIGVHRKVGSAAAMKLEEEGWVEFRKGKGYYICPTSPRPAPVFSPGASSAREPAVEEPSAGETACGPGRR